MKDTGKREKDVTFMQIIRELAFGSRNRPVPHPECRLVSASQGCSAKTKAKRHDIQKVSSSNYALMFGTNIAIIALPWHGLWQAGQVTAGLEGGCTK
jgi:hypothetical protein